MKIEKNAVALGITDVTLRLTAKLDCLAARDNNGVLVSRGDGR